MSPNVSPARALLIEVILAAGMAYVSLQPGTVCPCDFRVYRACLYVVWVKYTDLVTPTLHTILQPGIHNYPAYYYNPTLHTITTPPCILLQPHSAYYYNRVSITETW